MAIGEVTWVVLAGGRATRMGEPKAELLLAGHRLIDLVIASVPASSPIIVVGPHIPLDREVSFCLEEPRFGGPVAALAAAVSRVMTPWLLLTAVDMPRSGDLALDLVEHLADETADALVPIDATGRRQPLCSALRTDAVCTALAELDAIDGASLRSLLHRMRVREISVPDDRCFVDLDTPDDLRTLGGDS